jgi:hypothetical protein
MTEMSPVLRKISALTLLAAGLALAGCEDQKLLELFDNKPKLSGTRVPVFPEGVPGVQQGVPPELVKGYQPPVDPQAEAQAQAQAQAQGATGNADQAAAAEQKKPEAAAKPKPKPKRVAQPRQPKPAAQPAADTAAAASAPADQPTSAPLADRWPSAQQETKQAPPPPPPQRSANTLLPWPGSAPQGQSPPTDKFTR